MQMICFPAFDANNGDGVKQPVQALITALPAFLPCRSLFRATAGEKCGKLTLLKKHSSHLLCPPLTLASQSVSREEEAPQIVAFVTVPRNPNSLCPWVLSVSHAGSRETTFMVWVGFTHKITQHLF